MAPLHVLTACMKCHEQQGYKVGDIRGGLSVTFAAVPWVEAVREQKRNLSSVHLAVWLLLSGLTLLALSGVGRQVLSLQQAKQQQDAGWNSARVSCATRRKNGSRQRHGAAVDQFIG